MSIPSDPLHTPPPTPSTPATSPQGQTPAPLTMKEVDPAGVWSKFLGASATPEEVQKFIQGLLKWINAEIQHQAQRAKEANEKLKRSAEGEE